MRQDPDDLGAFPHLSPQQWEGEPTVTDFLDQDVSAWERFQCHCYPEWTGTWCERPQWIEPLKGMDFNFPSQYYDICDNTAHDNSAVVKSNICPPSIYDENTEFR